MLIHVFMSLLMSNSYLGLSIFLSHSLITKLRVITLNEIIIRNEKRQKTNENEIKSTKQSE